MSFAHLEKLNDHQRKAVEYGVGLPAGTKAGPLLVIAGAGSGKTNTRCIRSWQPCFLPLFEFLANLAPRVIGCWDSFKHTRQRAIA